MPYANLVFEERLWSCVAPRAIARHPLTQIKAGASPAG